MKKSTSALIAATTAAGLLAASITGADAAARKSRACRDSSLTAKPIMIRVGGEKATGHYALPSADPSTLVVFAHGYGHTSYSWVAHMERVAAEGALAVGMDYRGLEFLPDDDDDGLPESRGWPAVAGAEDSIAAAQLFEARCPSVKMIVILGVSMGGNMSGLAVAMAGEEGLTKSEGDEPLFDYWFDIEGAVNMTETYMEARLAGPASETAVTAQEDIEKETGGTFEQNPEAYLDRTVVARTDDIQAAGLEGVVVVHALNDGLVPYNQSRELVGLLSARGVPLDMFTVTTRDSDSEKETTITGYVTDNIDANHKSPLVGHASEASETHIVMNVAFERLLALLEGDAPGSYSEFLVYGMPDDENPHYAPGP